VASQLVASRLVLSSVELVSLPDYTASYSTREYSANCLVFGLFYHHLNPPPPGGEDVECPLGRNLNSPLQAS
jgi:hypothetical protein